jgi:hypothetical protein
VVCMGSSCRASFTDCEFNKCALLVLEGARVTLEHPRFNDMGKSAALLSVYAHGSGSQVCMNGGSITGGIQGVALQAGAHMRTSDITISGVEVTGIEVNDEGSSLTVTRGKLSEFSTRYDARHVFDAKVRNRSHVRMPERRGVHVHSGGAIELSSVFVSGMWKGVCVYEHSHAKLAYCTVTGTEQECMQVAGHSTASLLSSTLSQSRASTGVTVCDAGSTVLATRCHFLENQQHGAAALSQGRLIADKCTSARNVRVGYTCGDSGSSLALHSCTSDGDAYGCCVTSGGNLNAIKVHVSRSEFCGFDIDSADAVLSQCSAVGCSGPGMYVSGFDGTARLEVEGCLLEHNQGCGILAGRNAAAIVRRCKSRGNGEAGYLARWNGAQMTVLNSSSKRDNGGCGVREGGVLSMDNVKVDGVVWSDPISQLVHAT